MIASILLNNHIYLKSCVSLHTDGKQRTFFKFYLESTRTENSAHFVFQFCCFKYPCITVIRNRLETVTELYRVFHSLCLHMSKFVIEELQSRSNVLVSNNNFFWNINKLTIFFSINITLIWIFFVRTILSHLAYSTSS